jgi:hypothetical protein
MRAKAPGLICAVLLLSQCVKSGTEVEVLSFKDSNPAMLGEQVVVQDLGLTFRPPKDWTTAAEAGFTGSMIGSFTVEPRMVFYRNDGTGFCMVSSLVAHAEPEDRDPVPAYIKSLTARYGGSNGVSYKNLRINQLPAVLLRITDKNNVIYKFVVTLGYGYCQIDFACPVSEFTDSVLDRMRASVSTIRLLPE